MGLRQYKYGEVVNSSPTNASAINYNNALTHLAAGSMQGAMDELYFAVAGAINQNRFSYEEQVVGTWLDGKPLYEKTLLYSNVKIANAVELPVNIPNIDFGFVYTGVFDNDGILQSTLPTILVSSSGILGFYYHKTNKTIYIRGNDTNAASATKKYYLTLRYTKTTD